MHFSDRGEGHQRIKSSMVIGGVENYYTTSRMSASDLVCLMGNEDYYTMSLKFKRGIVALFAYKTNLLIH